MGESNWPGSRSDPRTHRLSIPALSPQASSTPSTAAGGKATTGWCIETSVTTARSQSRSGDAVTSRSAPSRRKSSLAGLRCSHPLCGGVFGAAFRVRRPPPGAGIPSNAFAVSVFSLPGSWVAEEWGACSRSCGKLGVQVRAVQCVQRLQDGTNRTLHTKYCPGQRPETRRPCSRLPCPAQWRTGAWSEVSCGQRRGGGRGGACRASWSRRGGDKGTGAGDVFTEVCGETQD